MNVQGRPTRPETAAASAGETFTGNRGPNMEEALIFESGRFDATGVDIDEPPAFESKLGTHARQGANGKNGQDRIDGMAISKDTMCNIVN